MRKMNPSRTSSAVCQVSCPAIRWSGGRTRGPRWPVTRPAMTAATSPLPPMCSAGMAARKGIVKETTVSTLASVIRARRWRVNSPTAQPTARATRTEAAKPSTTPLTVTAPAVAAVLAEDRTTRAVASLSRPSPSRTVMMRCETPRRLAMEMATASVGLRTAPTAMAHAGERPGMTRVRTPPMTAADTITRRIARTTTEASSRRKLMVEMPTAVAYRRGGRIPSRMISGSTSMAGTTGRKPTTMPPASSRSAGATRTRSLIWVAPAIASRPTTAMMRRSMGASLRFAGPAPGSRIPPRRALGRGRDTELTTVLA